MDRRSFVGMAVTGAAALATSLRHVDAETFAGWGNPNGAEDDNLMAAWLKMDQAMRSWWDGDLERADEEGIRRDGEGKPLMPVDANHPWTHAPAKSLLFLPFPYSSGGGSVGSFPEMYGWDTHFINLGLLAHDRTDIMRWNILDQLFMIERFGKVLNGNRTYYLSRGQPPLLAWSVEKYLTVKKDDEGLALLAYANLQRAYNGYWNVAPHLTPIGLATCHDSGDKSGMEAEQAAECEAGLDFTPIFGGRIGDCVPIHINCALVREAQVLASLAERFGWSEKAAHWRKEAENRAELINRYCWDPKEGFYFEYDYVRKTRLSYYSLNGYWPLWINIASKQQAQKVVDHLSLFDHPYGLTFTDRTYPEVHPQYKALEWAYPESWPQQQIVVAEALQQYGHQDKARMISQRYMANVIHTWQKTGLTWERYNGVGGGHSVPVEREPPQPLHGFSSAAAVVVGRIAFS